MFHHKNPIDKVILFHIIFYVSTIETTEGAIDLIQKGWWMFRIERPRNDAELSCLIHQIRAQASLLTDTPWHFAAQELLREVSTDIEQKKPQAETLAMSAPLYLTKENPPAVRLIASELLIELGKLSEEHQSLALDAARESLDDFTADNVAGMFARRVICRLSKEREELLSCIATARDLQKDEWAYIVFTAIEHLPPHDVCDLMEEFLSLPSGTAILSQNYAKMYSRACNRLVNALLDIMDEEETQDDPLDRPLASFEREMDTKRFSEILQRVGDALEAIPNVPFQQACAIFDATELMMYCDDFYHALLELQRALQLAEDDPIESKQLIPEIQERIAECKKFLSETANEDGSDDEDGLTAAR